MSILASPGGSKLVIRADEGLRGGRRVPLKANADAAIAKTSNIVQTMIVVKRTGGKVDWIDGRDVRYEDEMAKASAAYEPAEMNAEDLLFILCTSGSTSRDQPQQSNADLTQIKTELPGAVILDAIQRILELARA